MSYQFNADEIFEMAERIEKNGCKFYRMAAEKADNQKNKELLLKLAKMEEEHEKVFSSLRKELSLSDRDPTVFDPDDQLGLYLQSMADGNVFDMGTDPAAFFTGQESMADILNKAIGMEKNSIIFYLGMKEIVSELKGKDKIDQLIKEEMSHIGFLSTEMASLSS